MPFSDFYLQLLILIYTFYSFYILLYYRFCLFSSLISSQSASCSSCVSPRLARSTSSTFFFTFCTVVLVFACHCAYDCVCMCVWAPPHVYRCVCDKVNDSIIKQNKQQANKMLMLHVALRYLETQLHELPSLPLPAAPFCTATQCFILSPSASISLALQATIKVTIKAGVRQQLTRICLYYLPLCRCLASIPSSTYAFLYFCDFSNSVLFDLVIYAQRVNKRYVCVCYLPYKHMHIYKNFCVCVHINFKF